MTRPTIQVIEKPKRPLSAYNIFFKYERLAMLAAKKQRGEETGIGGFANLARTVSAKWKNISSEEKTKFQELAREEQVRYRKGLIQWKKMKKQSLQRSNGKQTSTPRFLPTLSVTSDQNQDTADGKKSQGLETKKQSSQRSSRNLSASSVSPLLSMTSCLNPECDEPSITSQNPTSPHARMVSSGDLGSCDGGQQQKQAQTSAAPTTNNDSSASLVRLVVRGAANERMLQQQSLQELAEKLRQEDALDCFVDLFL